jgi:hypothetical protein
MARKKKTPQYEQRLILFLDFLGFKEIVAATEDDPGALNRLLAAMDSVGDINEGEAKSSQRVTQFSDSLVVSYRIDEPSAVFWLLWGMALAVLDLAHRGYLVRGGVTMGPLIHNKQHLVGPAMVRAYEMESREAKYPRVIIDPAVFEVARMYRKEGHTPKDEERYARSYTKEDEDDGKLYFDYISWDSVVGVAGGDDERFGRYFQTLSDSIKRGLAHSDAGVLEKYLWLQRRYVAEIKQFSRASDAYKEQSPENYELIRSLPRFSQEAKAARKAVKKANKAEKKKARK